MKNIVTYIQERDIKEKTYPFTKEGAEMLIRDIKQEKLNKKVSVATTIVVYGTLGILFYKGVIGVVYIKKLAATKVGSELVRYIMS